MGCAHPNQEQVCSKCAPVLTLTYCRRSPRFQRQHDPQEWMERWYAERDVQESYMDWVNHGGDHFYKYMLHHVQHFEKVWNTRVSANGLPVLKLKPTNRHDIGPFD